MPETFTGPSVQPTALPHEKALAVQHSGYLHTEATITPANDPVVNQPVGEIQLSTANAERFGISPETAIPVFSAPEVTPRMKGEPWQPTHRDRQVFLMRMTTLNGDEPMNRKDIADLLGISPTLVQRSYNNWQDSGIDLHNGKYSKHHEEKTWKFDIEVLEQWIREPQGNVSIARELSESSGERVAPKTVSRSFTRWLERGVDLRDKTSLDRIAAGPNQIEREVIEQRNQGVTNNVGAERLGISERKFREIVGTLISRGLIESKSVSRGAPEKVEEYLESHLSQRPGERLNLTGLAREIGVDAEVVRRIYHRIAKTKEVPAIKLDTGERPPITPNRAELLQAHNRRRKLLRRIQSGLDSEAISLELNIDPLTLYTDKLYLEKKGKDVWGSEEIRNEAQKTTERRAALATLLERTHDIDEISETLGADIQTLHEDLESLLQPKIATIVEFPSVSKPVLTKQAGD